LSVNVKWYLKRDGLLDLTVPVHPDRYLAMVGPRPSPSAASVRPWCIASVHLFDAGALIRERTEAGVKVGVATGVPASAWEAAEIYPRPNNPELRVAPEQFLLLDLFAPGKVVP
jgi:hypothetical protein